jgi:tryptophan synthase alpha chain
MSKVDQLFRKLRDSGQKAFIPFVTAGDPDLETSIKIVSALADSGATITEIGVPYSDPIADGPIIQASYQRSLARGFRLPQLFEIGHKISENLEMPLVTMASYSIIHRTGIERYIRLAKEAGYCGAVVPDLLIEEAKPLSQSCREADFSLIQLVTPTTPPQRQLKIASLSSGFLYFVSVTGITGERREIPHSVLANIEWLRSQMELPICVGFGISSAATAKIVSDISDGVIIGSAIVRRISEASSPEMAIRNVTDFAREIVTSITT